MLKYAVNYSLSKYLLSSQCAPGTLVHGEYSSEKTVFVLHEIRFHILCRHI